MMIKGALLSVAVACAVLLVANAYIDQCSQYQSCQDCLFNGTQHRPYCGWCHMNVHYKSGGIGGRCVDQRDQPHVCPSIFNTDKCTQGIFCNYTASPEPKCELAPPGEGPYANDTMCSPHCFPLPDVYLCNTTTYKCEECMDRSNPQCHSKQDACANCAPPTDVTFRCDHSNATNPQCLRCPYNPSPSLNCSNFSSACDDCYNPGPSPPTPPPPPHNATFYQCNATTFQCQKASSGTIQPVCSQQCSNSTPGQLPGTWRGFQVQHGFTQGEFDFNFTLDGAAIMRDAAGNTVHARASNVDGLRLTFTDGPNAGHYLSGYVLIESQGPETSSLIIAFGALDQPAPQSLDEAMNATKGETVYILSECNAWKSGFCNFEPAFQSLRNRRGLLRASPLSAVNIFEQGPANENDPCNQYGDCTSCIGARIGPVECGWCQGGDIIYDKGGKSPYKCAGYQNGVPYDFTCTNTFRTEDCKGFNCQWNATTPTCSAANPGEYPTDDSCEQVCKQAHYAKCDYTTKQCVPCQQGQPDCTTTDVCNAACSQDRYKCNFTTSTCSKCDPATDPTCRKVQSDCDSYCQSNTYGKCDPATGSCIHCDPTSGDPGCVQSCNATCKSGALYGCNTTTHVCQQATGTMPLQECAETCIPHNRTGTYGCDFSNPNQPQCKEGFGHQTQQDCERNCHPIAFAKCNHTSGQCESCTPGTDPECVDTTAHCALACKRSQASGTYRGIQINMLFKRGEWDMTFYDDGSVAFSMFNSSVVYEATVDQDGPVVNEGSPIKFTLTKAPSGGPIDVKVGDVLNGVFENTNDEEYLTEVMYLALGLPNNAATSFDDGMKKLEFVMFKCRTAECDFSKALVPK